MRFALTRHKPLELLLELLSEETYAADFKTIDELKDTTDSGIGQLHLKINVKALTDPGTIRLPEVTLRKKAQTGSFTKNTADGQRRVGMTDDVLNLPCHFIGNIMISLFWKCDVKYTNY